jgi:hypothetical protein
MAKIFHERLIADLEAMGYAIGPVTKADTYTPPEGVQSAARRALKLIADGHAGDGFTDVGRKRASDLAAGRSVSLNTVKRMHSYFARHAVDKQGKDWDNAEKPSPGKVAWLAWGGDAGKSWADAIVDRDNVTKAYKRKYATREEAARAAANARWGNRTPDVPEVKEKPTKKVDPVKEAYRAFQAEAKKKKNLEKTLELEKVWLNAVRDNAPPKGDWRECDSIKEAKAQFYGQGWMTEVHFGKLSVPMVNEVCKTWNELGTKYPEVAAYVEVLGGHSGLRDAGELPVKKFSALGTAFYGPRTIALNDSYSRDQYEDFAQRAAATGFHPPRTGAKGDGVRSVLVHEFGHMVGRKTGLSQTEAAIKEVRSSRPAGIREKTVKEFTKTNLSEYATRNSDEAFAEAFTEYHMSPNPRPLATAIVERSFDAIGKTEWKRDTVAKAYKRKYATREEAARAAANARWGNRTPKVDAPAEPAGPVIEPWVDQKSAAAVDREFNRRWGNRTLMRLTGLSPEAANGSAEAINELLTLYPDTTLHLVGTQTGISQMIKSGTYPPGTPESVKSLASRGRYPKMNLSEGGDYSPQLQFIRINKNNHSSDGYGSVSTRLSEETGWYTPTGFPVGAGQPEGIRHAAKRSMVHEFGHAIDLHPKRNSLPSDFSNSNNPITKATREITGAPASSAAANKAVIETNIGTYAATNAKELFAETFTEYHMNPAARPLSVDFVKFRMGEIGVPLAAPSTLGTIAKAYKRKYGSRAEAARAAANARWGNKGSATQETSAADDAVYNPSPKEMLAGKTASGRKLRNTFSQTPVNGYNIETDPRPFGSAPEHLKRGALLLQGTGQALWQVTSVKGDVLRSKPVYDKYGRKIYKPGTSQSLLRQYWDNVTAVKGNAADLPDQDDAIAKAYKRKYATRAEAARAAANARWGNKGSTSTAAPAEPKPQITKETDKVLRQFAQAGYAAQTGMGMRQQKGQLHVGVDDTSVTITDLYAMQKFPRSDPRAKALLAYQPEGKSSFTVKIGKGGKVGLHPEQNGPDMNSSTIDELTKKSRVDIGGFKPIPTIEGSKQQYVATEVKNPKTKETATVYLRRDQYDGILASQPPGTELKVGFGENYRGKSRILSVVAINNGEKVAAVMAMGPNFDPTTGGDGRLTVKKVVSVHDMRAPVEDDAITKFVSSKRSAAGRKAAEARWGKRLKKFPKALGRMTPRQRASLMLSADKPAKVKFVGPEGKTEEALRDDAGNVVTERMNPSTEYKRRLYGSDSWVQTGKGPVLGPKLKRKKKVQGNAVRELARVRFADAPVQKAGDRSAAGRKAAEARWAGHQKKQTQSSPPADKPIFSREEHAIAIALVERVAIEEPALTKQMEDFAEEFGGELTGLQNRLKKSGSLARKIHMDAIEKSLSPEAAAAQIKDAVRYTMILPDTNYGLSGQAIVDRLRAEGNDVKVKNTWSPDSEYKGINLQVYNKKKGFWSELQLHTPQSFATKNETHKIYELERVEKDPKKKALYTAQMKAASGSLRIPPRAEVIKSKEDSMKEIWWKRVSDDGETVYSVWHAHGPESMMEKNYAGEWVDASEQYFTPFEETDFIEISEDEVEAVLKDLTA